MHLSSFASDQLFVPTATTSGHALTSYAPTVYTNQDTASLLEQIAATMASKTEITNELNKRLLNQAEKSKSGSSEEGDEDEQGKKALIGL